MSEKALAGTRVVELCQSVAGAYCAKLLADLGAEVLKIEEPGVGDEARRRGPFLNDIPDQETSGLFLLLNTNKMGITLSLRKPTGKRIFKQLIEKADILVEDNVPGTLKELGLGYEALRETNPRLIKVSISPFGQTGPYRSYKAFHLNTFHSGGEGYVTPGGIEYLRRPPLKAGNYVGDYEVGLSSALVAVAALYCQRRSGLGQHIDISKQESLMSLNPGEYCFYCNFGLIPSRASRIIGFGGRFPCKDGYVEIGLYEEHQWQALVQLMGNPEWAKSERFKDRAGRNEHSTELDRLIAEFIAELPKQEAFHKGQVLGCPIAPYNTVEDVVNSKQLAAREFFIEVDHPKAGRLKYPSAPYRFSRTPWAVHRPAPLLGEHNEEIYCQRLAINRQELVQLRRAGVI